MLPLVLTLAPTGMVPTKATSPHVPLAVDDVLADVAEAAALGVSVVHLHARRPDGTPSMEPDDYAELVRGVRAIDPELVVGISCSGRTDPSLAARARVLELDGDARPDLASLTLGSNNFRTQASVNAPDVVEGLAAAMAARGIRPELEVFEPGMLAHGVELRRRGVLPDGPLLVNVLLGNPGTSPRHPAVLAAFLALMPEDWRWGLAGIGREQLDATMLAVATGGHVRTGLEDNGWLDRGRTTPARNADLVRRVVRLAELAERPLATPQQARELLGLGPAA